MLALFLALLVSASTAQTTFTPDVSVVAKSDDVHAKVVLSAYAPLNDRWTADCFVLLNGGGYSNITCGPALKLSDRWTAMAGAGIDTSDVYWITSALVSYAGDVTQGYVMSTYGGGSGFWHKAVVTWPIPCDMRLGLISQRYDGEGLYGQTSFDRYTFYGAVLFQTEEWIAGTDPPTIDTFTAHLGLKVKLGS